MSTGNGTVFPSGDNRTNKGSVFVVEVIAKIPLPANTNDV